MHNVYNNGSYLENNPTWHEEDAAWKVTQIVQLINGNNLNPSTICEIGCGAGEILNLLSLRFPQHVEFFGFEISRQAFTICQKKTKKNLKYFFKDLLKESVAFFDIVMAIDVFEHVEEYFIFLRQLKTKGRYKIFHIPLDLSVQTVLRGSPIINKRKRQHHIHYFTKETALATLEDTGYEILDYFYTGSSLALPHSGFKTRVLNIPRKLLFSIAQDLTVRILGGFSLMVLAR